MSGMYTTIRRGGTSVVATRVIPSKRPHEDAGRASRVAITRRIHASGQLRALQRAAPLRRAIIHERVSSAVRVRRQRVFLALPLLACSVLLGDALVRARTFVRVDALGRLPSLLPAAFGALAVTALATWLATDSRLRWRSGTSLRYAALAAGPLSLFPLLIVLGDGAQVQARDHDLHPWGLPCFALAYVIAAAALIVLAAELRRQGSMLVTWQGVALGSAAASWSALALLLHCPGAEPQHLVVGHVLPICALPLVGLVFARHALRLV